MFRTIILLLVSYFDFHSTYKSIKSYISFMEALHGRFPVIEQLQPYVFAYI